MKINALLSFPLDIGQYGFATSYDTIVYANEKIDILRPGNIYSIFFTKPSNKKNLIEILQFYKEMYINFDKDNEICSFHVIIIDIYEDESYCYATIKPYRPGYWYLKNPTNNKILSIHL